MSALTANVAVAAGLLLAGVSLLLAVVGLVAYVRVGHKRLAWVALAFLLFFGKGTYLAIRSYREPVEAWPVLQVVDLVIVLALYFAVLKR